MKILFDNRVKESTLSATNQNDNYPAENVIHQFLQKKFKSLTYSSVVTISFDDEENINSLFYGYSNMSACSAALYNSSNVLLDTVSVDCTYETGSVFFDTVESVRKIVLTVTCPVTSDLYIGGIAAGLSVDFPKPTASFEKTLTDNSSKETSTHGQVAYSRIKPLVGYALEYSAVERETFHQDVIDNFTKSGIGHIWVDITEENHSLYQPLYCTSNAVESPSRDYIVSFSINLLEAR